MIFPKSDLLFATLGSEGHSGTSLAERWKSFLVANTAEDVADLQQDQAERTFLLEKLSITSDDHIASLWDRWLFSEGYSGVGLSNKFSAFVEGGLSLIESLLFTQEDTSTKNSGVTYSLNLGTAGPPKKVIVASTGRVSSDPAMFRPLSLTEGRSFLRLAHDRVDSASDYNRVHVGWVVPTGGDVTFQVGTITQAYASAFTVSGGVFDLSDMVFAGNGDSESPVNVSYEAGSFSMYQGGAEGTDSPIGLEGAGTLLADEVRPNSGNVWYEIGFDIDSTVGNRDINIDNNGVVSRISLLTTTIPPATPSGANINLTFIDMKGNAVANVDPGVTISPAPVATEDYIVILFGQLGSNHIATFDGQTPVLLGRVNGAFQRAFVYHVTGVTAASPAIVLDGGATVRNTVAVYKVENWDHIKFLCEGEVSENTFNIYGEEGGAIIGVGMSKNSNVSLGITGLDLDSGPIDPENDNTHWMLCSSKEITSSGNVSITQDADGVNLPDCAVFCISLGRKD